MGLWSAAHGVGSRDFPGVRSYPSTACNAGRFGGACGLGYGGGWLAHLLGISALPRYGCKVVA